MNKTIFQDWWSANVQRNDSATCSDSLLLYTAGADPLYRNEYNGFVTPTVSARSIFLRRPHCSMLAEEVPTNNAHVALVLHKSHRALAQAVSRPLRRCQILSYLVGASNPSPPFRSISHPPPNPPMTPTQIDPFPASRLSSLQLNHNPAHGIPARNGRHIG